MNYAILPKVSESHATKLPYLEVFAGESEGELFSKSSPLATLTSAYTDSRTHNERVTQTSPVRRGTTDEQSQGVNKHDCHE